MSNPTAHELPLQKRRVLLRVWLAGLLISLLMPLAGYWLGRTSDCKPGQIDGLCGMGSFFILVAGVCTGGFTFIAVSAYVVFLANRFPKEGEGSPLKPESGLNGPPAA